MQNCMTHTIYSKTSTEENFHNFRGFHSIMNLFLQVMPLLIGNKNLQECYSKCFTMNSYFSLQM